MKNYMAEIRKLVSSRPVIMAGLAIIILNKSKEILLKFRSDSKVWGLTGGAMELDETLEETAKRELYEETGFTAGLFKFIDFLSGEDMYHKYPNGDEIYSVIALYKAYNIIGELVPMDDESLDLRYFSREKLSSLQKSTQVIIKNALTGYLFDLN